MVRTRATKIPSISPKKTKGRPAVASEVEDAHAVAPKKRGSGKKSAAAGSEPKGSWEQQVASLASSLHDHPEILYDPSMQLEADVRQALKSLYVAAISVGAPPSLLGLLDELYVEDGVDEEQVWAQLQYLNQSISTYLDESLNALEGNVRSATEMSDVLSAQHLLTSFLADVSGDEGSTSDISTSDSDASMLSSADDDDEEGDEDEEDGDEDGDDAEVDDSELAEGEDEFEVDSQFEDDSEDENANENGEERPNGGKRGHSVRAQLRDGFFDLDDMEAFLIEAEEEEEAEAMGRKKLARHLDHASDDDSDDDADEDGEEDEEDDEEEEDDDEDNDLLGGSSDEAVYADFFDPPQRNMVGSAGNGKDPTLVAVQPNGSVKHGRVSSLLDDEEQDQDQKEEGEAQSRHQRKKARISSMVESLEQKLLEEKSWLLKGETQAKNRPHNALLAADLVHESYDRAPAPVTVNVTLSLEAMIKDRIKKGDFDNVIPRTAGEGLAGHRQGKDVTLSTEKSSMGLAEEYANIYSEKQKAAMEKAAGGSNKEMTEPQLEVVQLMRKLSRKLSRLTSAVYRPQLAKNEAQIVTNKNVAAAVREEVAPVLSSTASMLAPAEVYQAGGEGGKLSAWERKQATLSLQEIGENKDIDRRAEKMRMKRARTEKAAKERADAEAKGESLPNAALKRRLKSGLGNKHAREAVIKKLEGGGNGIAGGAQVVAGTPQAAKAGSRNFFANLQAKAGVAVSKKDADKKALQGGGGGGGGKKRRGEERSASNLKL
jgi:U3 small nucleolar RNA-associated protein MPP10